MSLRAFILSLFLVSCAREEIRIIEVKVLDPVYFDKLLHIAETTSQLNQACMLRYESLALKYQKHILLYHGIVDDGHY